MKNYENKKVEFKLIEYDNDGKEITPPEPDTESTDPIPVRSFEILSYVESSSKVIPVSNSAEGRNQFASVGEEVKSKWMLLFDEKKIPAGVKLLDGWKIKVPYSSEFFPILDILSPSGRFARKVEIFI